MGDKQTKIDKQKQKDDKQKQIDDRQTKQHTKYKVDKKTTAKKINTDYGLKMSLLCFLVSLL